MHQSRPSLLVEATLPAASMEDKGWSEEGDTGAWSCRPARAAPALPPSTPSPSARRTSDHLQRSPRRTRTNPYVEIVSTLQHLVLTRQGHCHQGMNKMVINHLDKLFITNDAATIVNELEVQHPAAKLLVLAAKAQQEEIGDGFNLTISFAGELLEKAEELIRMGLHPSEIIIGYTKAINKVYGHRLLRVE
ncbi:hypothetical protein ACQ4PT_070325 [Festuca glaucescens]